MKRQKQTVVSQDYDLADFSITRTMKRTLMNCLTPVGNFGGGPGWFNLTILFILHKLPRFFYLLIMLFEEQTSFLYRKITEFLAGDMGAQKKNEKDISLS